MTWARWAVRFPRRQPLHARSSPVRHLSRRCTVGKAVGGSTSRSCPWRKIAERVVASFPTCPIPEIARLGRTLKRWSAAFLAYFDTGRSNNGGTEAINGLIELHRRVARGFRNYDNYRLRMLLIGGGLRHPHLR